MAALVEGFPVVVIEKHPSAITRLQLDWTTFAEDATISTSSWVNAVVAAGVTLSGPQVSGLKTSTLVSSGTIGQTAYVENHVQFNDGRLEIFTFSIVIASKVPV